MEWSNKIGVFTKTQGTKQQAIQKTPLVFMIYLPLIKSGPGRIELPSKRGNHMLSTCLSLPSVFEHKQDQSHQPMPYLLIFRKSYGEELKLSPILLSCFIKRFGARAFERHLVSTTLAEIKLIYYTSIKQRA